MIDNRNVLFRGKRQALECKLDMKGDVFVVKDKRILVMPAYASVASAVEAPRLGAYDYLLKPVVFEDLLQKIDFRGIFYIVVFLGCMQFVLEEGVRKLTSDPADLFGLKDRGRLVKGAPGDVAIFDPARIGSSNHGERRFDLPGNAKRIVMPSRGVEYTVVNGAVTWDQGKLTDAKVKAVITRTLETWPKNATHWSTRTMAEASGLNQNAIVRIWRAFGLKPHLQENFKRAGQ